MTRKLHKKPDPFERVIEMTLAPGCFIPYNGSFAFIADLEDVEKQLQGIIQTKPARAAALYETFLACCHVKADEIDDSNGDFGDFVSGLFCGWIRARQAAETDPDDTASRLLDWMEDDPYGFCCQLEKKAVKVLNRTGLTALLKQIQGRLDGTKKVKTGMHDVFKESPGYYRSRWGDILRAVHIARKDVESYVALTVETGLTPGDCLAIATMLVSKRRYAAALEWVDRGIELNDKSKLRWIDAHELAGLRREILTQLGRGEEALDAAWADFRKYPCKFAYDELMKFVPRAGRKTWHEKAIEAAQGAKLHSRLELLLETRELDRLADLVRQTPNPALEGLSHYTTEPIAIKLDKAHPDLAARLWIAQGMRIVNAGKSKYYHVALANFEKSKLCFERAGLAAEWEKVASRVRTDHRRKSGFMPGFERLAAGFGPGSKPSFVDLAKARWSERTKGHK
jgi:tetratricopeptide (TPR) repeat protein